ncbi:MAG: hypothetical protein JRI68_30210, partial [Deltaproteobacteria bacterium]|nr:hypothetical protein [Deltaproteobacteria bacterium]
MAETVARVETGDELRFGVITTGHTVTRVRQLGAVELSRMEWHGNPVGDRWTQASVTSCGTCEGYTLLSLDLLDGRVFRAEVLVDPRPRPPATRADALC